MMTSTENRADLTKLPLTMRELQQDYEVVMAKELDLDARWQDPVSDMDACRNAVRDLQMVRWMQYHSVKLWKDR